MSAPSLSETSIEVVGLPHNRAHQQLAARFTASTSASDAHRHSRRKTAATVGSLPVNCQWMTWTAVFKKEVLRIQDICAAVRSVVAVKVEEKSHPDNA